MVIPWIVLAVYGIAYIIIPKEENSLKDKLSTNITEEDFHFAKVTLRNFIP